MSTISTTSTMSTTSTTSRLIVISDLHGNLPALEAVLADISSRGQPDLWWVLGDLAVFCPWPSETIARLRALPNVAFLQGNTDRYLVTGQRPQIVIHSDEDWDDLRAWIAERDANFRWTLDHLTYADYAFLRDLPSHLHIEIPGYGTVAAVHATAHDDETFLLPDTPDEQLAAAFDTLDARLILCGHTHRPVDRTLDSIRIVNDGSVGMPLDGDPRPAYLQLDFDGPDCQVTIRRVDYDRQAVIAELERVRHPARSWVIQRLEMAR